MGGALATPKFFEYKKNIIHSKTILENYFNSCMTSIRNGMPEVKDEP